MAYERHDQLEFQAPIHTVLERRIEGLQVVTRVLIEGEFEEFVMPYDHAAHKHNSIDEAV